MGSLTDRARAVIERVPPVLPAYRGPVQTVRRWQRIGGGARRIPQTHLQPGEPMSIEQAAHAAFCAALAEIPNPGKTSAVNAGNMKFKFAPLPDILDLVKPILAKHGLYVTFPVEPTEKGMLVSCAIRHSSGVEVARSSIPAATDGKEQAVGIRLTYYRRYAIAAVLGIAADEDTDGDGQERPGKQAPQSEGVPEYVAFVEERIKGKGKEDTAQRQAAYGRILVWAEKRAPGASPSEVVSRILAGGDVAIGWVLTGATTK